MMQKKPEWLRKRIAAGPDSTAVEGILKELSLNTVCNEARCPNCAECFAGGTATLMIMGTRCTRACSFCNVACGPPERLDPEEPQKVAEAVARMRLRYAVITSVTRDDLPDGGAAHFAATVRAIRGRSPMTAVEALVPDFQGDMAAVAMVADAWPAVISHNIETAKELYGAVRPQADYRRSLRLIEAVKGLNPTIRSKSGFMLGLGESRAQVLEMMDDLRGAGCELLAIGQYLAPSSAHYPVREYIHPDIFDEYRQIAMEKGFSFVAAGPFVRSSYHAGEALGR
jgi:lipoic acid synthetase